MDITIPGSRSRGGPTKREVLRGWDKGEQRWEGKGCPPKRQNTPEGNRKGQGEFRGDRGRRGGGIIH